MTSAVVRAGRAAGATGMKSYPRPQLTAARFVARRLARSGAVWGLVFGLYVYDNAVSFDSLAATARQRTSLLTAMGGNTGLKALLGDTRGITTLGGFTDWRGIGVTTLVACIWGLLAATKYLRGEEAAGRWELFLSGQATARRATAGVLAALGTGVLAMYLLTALLTIVVGARPKVGIGVGQGLFFAVAVVAGAAIFAAVGALASQLMPTRSRATGLAAAVFGASFMLRALGDATSSAHWLVYLSPMGWVEQMHPLTGAAPLWLLPIAGLIAACVIGTLMLADRDLGSSLLADSGTAPARTAMLSSPVRLALRMSWASITAWVAAAIVAALLYGSFAKAAGKAFASSSLVRRITGNLTSLAQHQLQVAGAKVYAGIVFLILMVLVMAYVASALGRAREEEAEGYLDNLLVRSVSRPRWLAGTAGLILVVAALAAVLGGAAFWAGAATQHAGLSFYGLLLAGLNSAAPAVALLGIGIAVFGFVPRVTTMACWGILAWSFLLDMLGSALKVNHWVMDTSLLYHVALAPAVGPNWTVVGVYLAIGCGAGLLGGWRFTRRDLASS